MGPGCRSCRGRRKDARVRIRPARPKPGKPSLGVSSRRPRWTRRVIRSAIRSPPLMLERSKRQRSLADGSMPRPYAEAVRRGLTRAVKVIVLGDGAPWIWGIAEEHFPGAIPIVDLYHAREHLVSLAKIAYEVDSVRWKQWLAARVQQLDAGEIESLVISLRRLRSQGGTVRDPTDKAIDYFQTNRQRMRYADFRRQGLFVGSGVIEAGCKTIIGQRLKRSGMHWTVRGANAIIALRCCRMSGRWEEFWYNRSARTS